MPRGDNPNSRKNLKTTKSLTEKERRELAIKGGKASGRARAEYKSLTEALKDQCTPDVMQQLTDMLIKRAKMGNLKAYELLRDQIGEKPIDRIQVTEVEQNTIDEIEAMWNGQNNSNPKIEE